MGIVPMRCTVRVDPRADDAPAATILSSETMVMVPVVDTASERHMAHAQIEHERDVRGLVPSGWRVEMHDSAAT